MPRLPLIKARLAVFGGLATGGTTTEPPMNITLLVDTGASTTCISQRVITEAGLHSLGWDEVSTPTRRADPLEFFAADLEIHTTDGKPPQRFGLEIGSFRGSDRHFHGLLGRDLLAQYHFEMTRATDYRLVSLASP